MFCPLYLHLCEMAHYQQTNQLALLSEHPLVIIRDSTENPQPGNTVLPSSLKQRYISVKDEKESEKEWLRPRHEFCLWIMCITQKAYIQQHKYYQELYSFTYLFTPILKYLFHFHLFKKKRMTITVDWQLTLLINQSIVLFQLIIDWSIKCHQNSENHNILKQADSL